MEVFGSLNEQYMFLTSLFPKNTALIWHETNKWSLVMDNSEDDAIVMEFTVDSITRIPAEFDSENIRVK